MENEKLKIAIFNVSEDYDYEALRMHSQTLPGYDWIEVTLDEFEIYRKYVDLKNAERKRSDRLTWVLYRLNTFDAIDTDITFEKAKAAVETAEQKKAAASAKRKAAAAKGKLTKEKNKLESQLAALEDIGIDFTNDKAQDIAAQLKKVKKQLAKK